MPEETVPQDDLSALRNDALHTLTVFLQRTTPDHVVEVLRYIIALERESAYSIGYRNAVEDTRHGV